MIDKPIAFGRTAEIYAWEDGQVLKLFYDWFELEDIEFEAQMGRAIHASGLPVPAVGALVRVNGRNGLIYQRVEGEPMLRNFSRQPWLVWRYARRCAELHAELHASSVQAEIPFQRDRLGRKIRAAKALPEHLRTKALAALESLPDGDRICHGDFHPGNILTSPKGETVIDWIDAARGNPLADVARTSILLLGAAACQVRGALPQVFVRLFHAVYLRRYFALRPGGEAQYWRWLPVVAAGRLSEQIPELEAWLVAQAGKGG
jgi:uncharacterized protein (TIGR02172 family)